VLNADDPANRRVIDFFARHDERDQPLDEPAYYPPMERLTTHPDGIEFLWKSLGSKLPAACARFVHGVPCLAHDRSGIVLAFALGTAYAFRLPPPEFAEALRAEASAVQKWSGGSVTDLSLELGPDWLWGRWWAVTEQDWVAASYRAFSAPCSGG
jgi:hypothetical protein